MHRSRDIKRVVRGLWRRLQRSVPGTLAHLAQTLVPGDGVEPLPQPGRVAQLTDVVAREQKRVVDGIGRRLPIADQGTRICHERTGITAVSAFKAAWVIGCDCCYEVPVIHGGDYRVRRDGQETPAAPTTPFRRSRAL